MLPGAMTASDLATIIRSVKGRYVPVTYSDVWEYWLRYRELKTPSIHHHSHPPILGKRPGARRNFRRSRRCHPQADGGGISGQGVLIGETGWPSEGRMRR